MEKYEKLQIIRGYTTKYILDGEEINIAFLYDVNVDEREFIGCLLTKTEVRDDEECAVDITMFFNSDGLEIKLKDGYLMRMNPEATKRFYEERELIKNQHQRESIIKEKNDATEKIKQCEKALKKFNV